MQSTAFVPFAPRATDATAERERTATRKSCLAGRPGSMPQLWQRGFRSVPQPVASSATGDRSRGEPRGRAIFAGGAQPSAGSCRVWRRVIAGSTLAMLRIHESGSTHVATQPAQEFGSRSNPHRNGTGRSFRGERPGRRPRARSRPGRSGWPHRPPVRARGHSWQAVGAQGSSMVRAIAAGGCARFHRRGLESGDFASPACGPDHRRG